jgi:hypothetical protein
VRKSVAVMSPSYTCQPVANDEQLDNRREGNAFELHGVFLYFCKAKSSGLNVGGLE